jgi:hypothetical protein
MQTDLVLSSALRFYACSYYCFRIIEIASLGLSELSLWSLQAENADKPLLTQVVQSFLCLVFPRTWVTKNWQSCLRRSVQLAMPKLGWRKKQDEIGHMVCLYLFHPLF